MKIILQNNEEDCLLACYAMLLNDLGHKVPLYEIYDKDSLPADGLNLEYLLSLNNRFHTTIKAYRASFEGVYRFYQENKRRLILHWNNDHFVVLEKINLNQVTIVDPAIGRLRYSNEEFLEHYSGTMVAVNKAQNFQEVKYKSIFWKYFKKTLRAKPIILFLISLLLIQVGVLLFSVVLRQILTENPKIISSILVLSMVIIFQLVGFHIKNGALDKYNFDFDKYYSNKVFQNILEKPLLYFRNQLSGGVTEKVNIKSILRDNVTLKIIPSSISLISVVVIFIYLMIISVRLSLILIIMIFIYSILSIVIYQRQNEYNQTYLQYLIDFNSELQIDLDDIDYIKIMRKEKKTLESWKYHNKQLTSKYSQILKLENFSLSIGTIFNYISLSMVIIIAVYYKDYIQISHADLLVYQTSISLLISSIEQVKSAVFEINRLDVYADRQGDLLKKSDPIVTPSKKSDEYLIRAKHLNFSYGTRLIYNNLNLTINKGEKLAIVGKSGSGKSTLLLLLAGVLRYEGELNYGVEKIEDSLSVVLQNMTLRKGSVLENLEWNSEDADLLTQVLDDTTASEVIEQLPNKIYSKLLKQGKNLSGGQIQKILIAKSLLKKDAIILWDEAFSNLDEQSKNKIYQNVLQNDKYYDKTMLIVSHHLDIVNYVNGVIFIDSETGKVIKDKHEHLMKTNINYQNFIKSKV